MLLIAYFAVIIKKKWGSDFDVAVFFAVFYFLKKRDEEIILIAS